MANLGGLIKQGRAKKFNSRNQIYLPQFKYRKGNLKGIIYLNCGGNIIKDGCYDYETQENKNLIICHVDNMINFEYFCKQYAKNKFAKIEDFNKALEFLEANA